MKNKEYIDKINYLLSELENNINLISFESTYHSIIVITQKICKLTLELQLKIEDPEILKNRRDPLFMILSCRKKDIMPLNQSENLHKMMKLYYEAIHGEQPTYQEIYSLLNALSTYISWFDSICFEKYHLKNQLEIESLILKISSLPKHQNDESIKENNIKTPNIVYLNMNYEGDDFKLTKQVEETFINQINNMLFEYEKQLSSIFPEKNYYFVFVGQNIIESMLKLIIKKEELQNSGNLNRFSQMIRVSYENQIIPQECFKFLNLIRRYRNEFAHDIRTPNKLIMSFLNAFSYFIQWYDNFYSERYDIKSPFKIENCCKKINRLNADNISKNIKTNKSIKSTQPSEYNYLEKRINVNQINSNLKVELSEKEELIELLKNEEKHDVKTKFESKGEHEISKDEQIKKLKEELKIKEKRVEILQTKKKILEQKEKSLEEELAKKDEEIKNNKQNNDLVLKKLAEKSKMFEKCMDLFIEHIATTERIETKIDAIDEKINHLTNQISTIQSFTERQIKNATSNEQVERILEDFMDECIDKIMSISSKIMENKNYEREKRKLIRSMGESAWMKLSEKSKSFLITSKVMYNNLIMIDDIIDYSGICVLVTKALEVEIHKRFFTGFLDYLYEKYDDDYSEYHSALLFQNKEPLFPDKFMMGDIAFVMCHIENWNDSQKQKAINKERLMEYCKSCIFSKYNEEEIERLLNYYASSIEKIRIKYRNPSAHTNEIKQVDAEECFNLVLDVEKLLKEMLDSFDN